MNAILQEAHRFRWCLIAVTLLAIAARMQSLATPMYSVDGYSGASVRDLAQLVLTQGRWGLAALVWLRAKLGFYGMDVAPSSLVLSTLLFTGAGFLYARALAPKLSQSELFIFAALLTLHPFVTEFYTFSDATLDIAIAFFVAAVGFSCASATQRPRFGTVVGCLLMVLSLSIYQSSIAHLAVVGQLGVLAWGLQDDPALTGPLQAKDLLASRQFRALATAATSAAFYLAAMQLLARIFHITLDGRARLSWPPDPVEKAHAFEKALQMTFLPLHGFTTGASAFFLAGLLLVSAVVLVTAMQRRRGLGAAVASVALLAAAELCTMVVPISGRTIWLVPRVLAPVSIFIAGVAMLGWRFAGPPWVRAVLVVALAPLLIAYVGTSNRILYDQRRLNLWDAQQANRILARLEADPHFETMRALAVMHGTWGRSEALPTMRGDMNVSGLSVAWSKVGLMAQATGDRFEAPSDDQQKSAEAYCATVEAWPAAASVTIADDLGIVCLPRNK